MRKKKVVKKYKTKNIVKTILLISIVLVGITVFYIKSISGQLSKMKQSNDSLNNRTEVLLREKNDLKSENESLKNQIKELEAKIEEMNSKDTEGEEAQDSTPDDSSSSTDSTENQQ